MKKIILALVVLALALPASAEVLITCEQVVPLEPNVVVSYVNDEAEPVRAFALVITVDEGTITAVSCLSDDYYIYPSSITIEDGVPGPWGECAIIDGNEAIIEMGSLHAPEDACHPDPPPDEGDLVLITVSEGCQISIDEEPDRGGVVMETPEDEPDVNAPGCSVVVDPYADTCWSAIQCPGQSVGDATCDGSVNIMDVLKVKQSWAKSFGETGYNACADFDHSCVVNIMDILKVKQNWGASGLGGDLTVTPPATCP